LDRFEAGITAFFADFLYPSTESQRVAPTVGEKNLSKHAQFCTIFQNAMNSLPLPDSVRDFASASSQDVLDEPVVPVPLEKNIPLPDGVTFIPPPDGFGYSAEFGEIEVVLSDEGELPPPEKPNLKRVRHLAIGATLVVHVVLAVLLALLVVAIPPPPISEISAITVPVNDQVPRHKIIAKQPPQQTAAQISSSLQFTTASMSAVAMPSVEFDANATNLDLGTSMGDFGSRFGAVGTGTIMMFGRPLTDVKKIAVVMDVSRSMTRYLPIVVDELHKIGRDSTLILYYGCALAPIDKLEPVQKVGGTEFDKYWQLWQGKESSADILRNYQTRKFDPQKPMPLLEVYEKVAKRRDTFFIDKSGSKTSVKSALLAKELRDADTVYWFADFMDRVDEDQAKEVVRQYRSKRRKLYIHSPHDRGPQLSFVREEMVKPLKGEVIILDIK